MCIFFIVEFEMDLVMLVKIGYLFFMWEYIMKNDYSVWLFIEVVKCVVGLGFDFVWVGDFLIVWLCYDFFMLLVGVVGVVLGIGLGMVVLFFMLCNFVIFV